MILDSFRNQNGDNKRQLETARDRAGARMETIRDSLGRLEMGPEPEWKPLKMLSMVND